MKVQLGTNMYWNPTNGSNMKQIEEKYATESFLLGRFACGTSHSTVFHLIQELWGELAESRIKRTTDSSAHQLPGWVYSISLSAFSKELMAKQLEMIVL